MAKKIKENKSGNHFALNAHVSNLASLQRRLNSVGNIQMRRKNAFDPIAYPSLFFRREGQPSKHTSIVGF